MARQPNTKTLSIVLTLVGLIFVFGIYPLTRLWPSGWSWDPPQAEYLQMILGIYATLGIFLLRAARDPLGHLSLIWFTVWSSLVHAGIMAYHSLMDPVERGHLIGDVAALVIVAVALAALTPRQTSARPPAVM